MKTEIIKKIIEYFEENKEVFNICIEELDGYNGCLGDDCCYEMEELSELFQNGDIINLLNRAYFGRDDENWHTDDHGKKIYDSFNPNREYFYFNGYGNLVSCNYKDYSDRLDHWTVESMGENRRYIDTIEEYEELAALFDELEEE